MKFLINKGAKIDAKEEKTESYNYVEYVDASTALHLAVMDDHLDVVKYLISQGANIFIKNNKDKDAFTLAIELGYVEIFKLLFESYEKLSAENKSNDVETIMVREAIKYSRFDIIKYLIVEKGK